MNEHYKEYLTGVGKLETIAANLSREQLLFHIAQDKWSITEVVAHLTDTEIQVYTRFRSILADDVPLLANHNEAKWAKVLKHDDSDIKENLSLFKLMRGINYRLIVSLNEEQLKREGLHSTRGRMTVEGLIKGHIVHLRNHIGQIEKNLAEYRNVSA